MAKFLDKKEQVIDFQLTPLGRRRLATGKLRPTYYSFYDDGVVYDSEYAGYSEDQNSIHSRIKNDTSYIKGILSFEEIENSTAPGQFLEAAVEVVDSVLASDFDISPDKNILQTNKFLFDAGIGDAAFEGKNIQAAPAWKVVTCQGEILSSTTRDTSYYDYTHLKDDTETREFNIPQIDVELYYTKLVDKPSSPLQYSSVSDSVSETQAFADGYCVKLVRDDMVIYAEEANTQLMTENFDIEVFEMNETAGEKIPSTGTIALRASANSNDFYGKTITINDGVNETTFEFITDLSVPDAGNVGVVVAASGGSDFQYLGETSAGLNYQATMYNLAAAIDDSFDNNYPTSAYYLGSDADGDPVESAGKCAHAPELQPKCVKDIHLNVLNVSVEDPPFIIDPGFEGEVIGSTDTVTFKITNNRPCIGDMGSITTDHPGIIVTGFSKCTDEKIITLERKFFEKEIPHIVDGLMKTKNPIENLNTDLSNDAVEYYFEVLTDTSVDAKIACECASTFNKNSYYIDIDFDEEICKDDDEALFFDIYGSVTVPEVCDVTIGDYGTALQPCEDEE